MVTSRRSAFVILASLGIISILMACNGSKLSESEAKKAILNKKLPLTSFTVNVFVILSARATSDYLILLV
jgi:hypothetical protein